MTKTQREKHLEDVKKAFLGFFPQPAVYMANRETKQLYVETVDVD